MFKKKMTKFGAIAMATCVTGSILALPACSGGGGKGGKDEDNTLQIYAVHLGYGSEWVEKLGEEFVKQDWVKAKYPDLKVTVKITTDAGNAQSMMTADQTVNPYELVIATQAMASSYIAKTSDGKPVFEDLSEVFEREIPNENITVGEKMNDVILKDVNTTLPDGTQKMYGFPWANSYMGIFVNEDFIKETFTSTEFSHKYISVDGGNAWTVKLPVTTDGLIELCNDLKTLNDAQDEDTAEEIKAIVSSMSVNYWINMFPTWWAQYEGHEAYENFWWGLNEDGEQDSSIFSQQGRLESLKTMESIIGWSHEFNRSDNQYNGYQQAQRLFLKHRGGAFMCNGDWLHCEMKGDYTDKITIYKTPVISAILNRSDITNIQNDAELAFLVQCIDKKDTNINYAYADALAEFKTKFGSDRTFTEKEYDRIFEARNTKYRLGGMQAHIPSYASMKDAAKDFLVFMATNQGIETMMKYTGGLSPYDYDVEVNNPTFFESLPEMQKSHCRLAINGKVLHDYQSTPLNYAGGLLMLPNNNSIETRFMSKGSYVAPETVFNNIADTYQGSDGSQFYAVLRAAGLK